MIWVKLKTIQKCTFVFNLPKADKNKNLSKILQHFDVMMNILTPFLLKYLILLADELAIHFLNFMLLVTLIFNCKILVFFFKFIVLIFLPKQYFLIYS